MKRHIMCLALLVCCLMPAGASAASFSWITPWSTGALSTGSSATVDGSGSLVVDTTSVSWLFNLNQASQTGSASATVNGQDFATSFNWSDLFTWLFLF